MREPGRGRSRVIIATDIPARVKFAQDDMNGQTGQEAIASLCAQTPCVVTLRSGDYRLKFSGLADEGRSSSVEFKVRNDTEVLNHKLGQERDNAGQYVGAGMVMIGGVAVLLGGLGVVAAKVLQDNENASQRSADDGAPSAAGIVALVGLLSVAIGAAVIATSPSIQQPGSTTQWSPEAATNK